MLGGHGEKFCVQRFVKCKGPKAFIYRVVWRKHKPNYAWVITNKTHYNDTEASEEDRFFTNPY